MRRWCFRGCDAARAYYSTAAPAGASETIPMILYGKRRVRAAKLEHFKKSWAASATTAFENNPSVKAVFAFPDPADPLAYWHVLWSRDVASFCEPADSAQLYESTADDPDTMAVYGGWTDATVAASASYPSVRFEFHETLAGYMKADGAGECGPPLFGFTKRTVKPGRLDALVKSFQPVCNRWYEKAPGILAAAVSQDKDDPNVVHDIRIMANWAAYHAHVDKTDEVLTAAMEEWFANYDTAVPFTGELYAEDTSDPALHTSSIRSQPVVRPLFATFHYGEGMLGPMPNMTKGD